MRPLIITLLMLSAGCCPDVCRADCPSCPNGQCPTKKPAPIVLVDGSVLASLWGDPKLDTSLGTWNHLAIVAGPDCIVESQADKGVVKTSFTEYLKRPYARITAFKPKDKEAGQRAALRALSIVGKEHGELSSLFRGHGLVTDKANCVTVAVEYPWGAEQRSCRSIVLPDGMFRPRINWPFEKPEVVR
jgi:hypothetical protein